MKKILLLLLISVATYGQVPADATPLENIQITNNTTDNSATKVVVQSANNVFNTVLKTDLQDAFYFATASALPVTGITDKLYITRDNNKLYRFNGTIYQELTTDISGKEDISNKSSSYTVSSTTTYPNTKALVDGLNTRVTTAGTTGNIQRIVGTNQLGNSALTDNGTSVQSALPLTVTGAITGTTIVKAGATATNILLAGGTDITQASLPVSTATQTALNLKANLASPTFTGVPLVPTATAGTNTLQAASTAFVLANGNAGGLLEFNTTDRTVWNNGKGNIASNTSFGEFSLKSGTASTFENAIYGHNSAPNMTAGSKNVIIGSNSSVTIANLVTPATTIYNGTYIGADISPSSNSAVSEIVIGQGAVGSGSGTTTIGQASQTKTILRGIVETAGSFVNTSAPATNVLLAGGTTLSQNTAFNKNFGTTAGTVVEGGTLGSNAYSSTAYLPSNDGVRADMNYNTMLASGFYNSAGSNTNNPVGQSYSQLIVARGVGTGFQIAGGWGTDALHFRGWGDYGAGFSPWRKVWHDGNFNPANYLPLTGATLSIYANDAAADADTSLLSGQFYKITGSRVVYQKP